MAHSNLGRSKCEENPVLERRQGEREMRQGEKHIETERGSQTEWGQ